MTDRTTVTTIGESIVFKGELSRDVDLVIDGQVEGKINLNRNALTVGEHGKVKAKIAAKTVVVVGAVWDSLMATENVAIRDTCFDGRQHLHAGVGDGPWGLCPRSHRHTAVAKRQGRRGVHRQQDCARTGQVPREVRCEAEVRYGERCSRPEIVAAPSERSWRSRWSASCCSRCCRRPVARGYRVVVDLFCVQ